jgi:Domain of unknown function (DUF5911)
MALRIEDYALIGDCRTAALVGRDGSIDWLCWPRFDSPACFAALLGTTDNGRWLIATKDAPVTINRRYRPGSLILETEFKTDTGCAVIIDFMPPADGAHLVRIVAGRLGRVVFHCHVSGILAGAGSSKGPKTTGTIGPVARRHPSGLQRSQAPGISQSNGPSWHRRRDPICYRNRRRGVVQSLTAAGLNNADARHLMYAARNECDRFVSTDPHFTSKRQQLEALCQCLKILTPSELAAELLLNTHELVENPTMPSPPSAA